jgi:hypothetical protein
LEKDDDLAIYIKDGNFSWRQTITSLEIENKLKRENNTVFELKDINLSVKKG